MLRIQIACNLSYLIVRFLKNYFYKKLLGGVSYVTSCVTWTQYYTHTHTHKKPWTIKTHEWPPHFKDLLHLTPSCLFYC